MFNLRSNLYRRYLHCWQTTSKEQTTTKAKRIYDAPPIIFYCQFCFFIVWILKIDNNKHVQHYLFIGHVLHTCQIGCLRRQNFTWELAGTSVGENPRWVRFHRIFVYTCKQGNIMCSCCVWPHENGLVGFYSLQKLFKLCWVFFPIDNLSAQVLKAVIYRHILVDDIYRPSY